MTFIWELTKGAYPFTEKEQKITLWMLNVLLKECPRTCAFFNLLPLDQLKFYWAPGMTIENGILGSWNMPTPDRVYMADIIQENLAIPESNISKSGTIKDMRTCYKMDRFLQDINVMTLVHELNHMFQYRTNKVLFVVNRLVTLFIDHIPFLEKIGIEYDSRSVEKSEELTDFLESFSQCLSSYISAISMRAPDDPENYMYQSWAGGEGYDDIYTKKERQYAREFINLINE